MILIANSSLTQLINTTDSKYQHVSSFVINNDLGNGPVLFLESKPDVKTVESDFQKREIKLESPENHLFQIYLGPDIRVTDFKLLEITIENRG